MAMKWPSWPWSRKTAVTQAVEIGPHTTQTHEQHSRIVSFEEASAARKLKPGKGPQNLSMAWDETSGLPGYQTRNGGSLSERDRKDTYYRAYITNPWVKAAVEATAKRFTSGKWEVVETEKGKGKQAHKDALYTLFSFVNEDEDLKQLLRSIAVDLGIFGESFVEIVYQNGVPAALYKIDAISMTTQYDKHGRVLCYWQELDHSTEKVRFEPDQIIRWWFPDPKANKKALSPIEGIKDSVYLYTSMITWGEKFFKQGGQPSFWVEMGPDANEDDASRYVKFFKENYTGIENAHVPPVFYGGSKMASFGKGSVELDFLKSLAWARDEILAGYNTPLNVIGIQETAHLGGGSGESSNKIFIYNTVKPVEELILEKFNYRIVKRGFGIDDWKLEVTHADYRDDKDIADVQDVQIKNGTLTINESRQERGRLPVEGGDTAIFLSGNTVTPVEVFAGLAEEHQQQQEFAKIGMQAAQQGSDDSTSGTDDDQGSNNPPALGQKQQPKPGKPFGGKESVTIPSHWQDDDSDTRQALKIMREKGVKRLKWRAHEAACPECRVNNGRVVEIGQRFPSGAYTVPNHNRCECNVEEEYD